MTGPPVDLEVTLRVTREGTDFEVWTEDDLLVVNAPSLTSLRALESLRDVPVGPAGDAAALADAAGLPVELRVRHAAVARVNGDGPPSALGRAVTGLDARLLPGGVLTAAVRALG